MRLLVTGCGHSGTRWVADVLRSQGYAVGHEKGCTYDGWRWDQAQDVEVSWCAAPYLYHVPPSAAVWQVVRHPLAVASSFRRREFFESAGQHRVLIDRTLKHLDPDFPELDYWVRWNRIVEARASLWWPVERLGQGFVGKAVEMLGRRSPTHPLPAPPVEGDRVHIRWTNYRRHEELYRMARRYGYTMES